MSVINYEQAGRIKSVSSHLRAASSARTRNKQRKWRVLLSIGLLLPALAAIIGIVAWAISIEVANTSLSPQSSALTTGNHIHPYRKHHHHHQELASKQRRQHQDANDGDSSAANRAGGEQQAASAAEGARSADRGPVQAAGGKASVARAQLSRRRANIADLLQQQAPEPQEKTKSESATTSEDDRSSSELLLRNIGHVQAIDDDGSSAGDTPDAGEKSPDRVEADNAFGSAEDDDDQRETAKSEQEMQQTDQEAPTDAPAEPIKKPIKAAQKLKNRGQHVRDAAASRDHPADEYLVIKKKSSNTDSATSDRRSAQKRSKQTTQQHSRAANRSPIISSEESALATSGAYSNNNNNDEDEAQESAKSDSSPNDSVEIKQYSFKLNNKAKAKSVAPTSGYTIVNKDTIDENGDRQQQDESASANDDGARVYTSDDVEEDPSKSDKAASMESRVGSRSRMIQEAIPFMRPEDEQRNRYVPQVASQADDSQSRQQRDEELSFEAIASAISTTLSANAESAPAENSRDDGGPMSGSSLIAEPNMRDSAKFSADSPGIVAGDSDTQQHSAHSDADIEAGSGKSPQGAAAARRRLTPGEHVAEVIDHIVERRKQSGGGTVAGPQIVVVAPVGGAQMMARSLTKETGGETSGKDQDAKTATSNVKLDSKASFRKPHSGAEPALSSKKEAISGKKPQPATRRTVKPLGARLLGVAGQSSSNQQRIEDGAPAANKFSERVEVIQDDDSSEFLFKSPTSSSGAADLDLQESTSGEIEGDQIGDIISSRKSDDAGGDVVASGAGDKSLFTLEQLLHDDQPASIHVSNRASEPRLRSPRHGGLADFERYAPLPSGADAVQQMHPAAMQMVPTGGGGGPSARIYSAEQLIAQHLLKSNVLKSNDHEIKRSSSSPQAGAEFPQRGRTTQSQPKKLQQPHPSPNKQVKVAPTTIRPHHNFTATQTSTPSSTSEQLPASQDSRQQPMAEAASEPMASAHAAYKQPGQQSQAKQHQQQDEYQQHAAADMQRQNTNFQPAQAHLANEQQQYQLDNQQKDHIHQEAAAAAPALPVFADQEFNVPAHMAESVIHNIQMSPVTVSMVNGQPTLVSHRVNPSGQQVPFAFHPQQYSQMHQQNLPPHQQIFTQHQPMMAASEPSPMYHHQPLAWQRLALANQRLQANHLLFNQQQRQGRSDKTTTWLAGGPKTITLNPAKGLMNPLAQIAFKHLINSLVGKQGEQPAAAANLNREENRPTITMSFPTSQQNPPPLMEASSQSSDNNMQIVGASAQKSARSVPNLPINDPMILMRQQGSPQMAAIAQQQPSAQQQQVAADTQAAAAAQPQEAVQDQDMEESYGQMPTYHMAPHGGYEGKNYHYEGDHDKKSKGITFHFGGGPIGGGTQLITSPMGIFKHLMIPLLPNPRVNLNGKVVFGVVLEKSTAIGGEPKKKFKFWGR